MNKKPTITQGIIIAVLFSIASIPLWAILNFFFYPWMAWRILVLVVACSYVGYILAAHRSSVGKFSLGLLSLAVFFTLAVITPPPAFLCLSCLGIIWFVRVILRYSSFLTAALDGILCLLALGAVVVTYSFTASIFFAIWSFLLIQSLAALIPRKLTPCACEEEREDDPAEDRFSTAYKTAQQALQELSQNPDIA